jgi:hypothetical protein
LISRNASSVKTEQIRILAGALPYHPSRDCDCFHDLHILQNLLLGELQGWEVAVVLGEIPEDLSSSCGFWGVGDQANEFRERRVGQKHGNDVANCPDECERSALK